MRLVIATDGLPTSTPAGASTPSDQRDFTHCLMLLSQSFPLFIVIRLCTDSDDVIDFYTRFDDELELPLEVLDDMESEAREVHKMGNRWLTYFPFLHQIRTAGTENKLFDQLDERALTKVEISMLLQLLLRRKEASPFPSAAEDFLPAVNESLMEFAPVYDPIRRAMLPMVDVSQLKKVLKKGNRQSGACTIV